MSDVPPTIGPYEVLGELGRGGMGVVYRVRRADLDREFALKLVRPDVRRNASLMKRLEREAQAAARLAGHPGIVGVHDAGRDGDAVYLVMDCVEGRSLDTILRDEEPFAPDAAAALIAEVARAVQYAHDHGVLHRDIKPANVMVAHDGDRPDAGLSPRLTDFGLARSQQADHDVTRLTQSDEVLGTPAYMPPEQACGEALDARADVYSLGATLYECLAGAPPFGGGSVVEVLTRVLREPPRPIAELAPHTPLPLQRIVSQCLAKPREERYDSAQALADDLDRFRRGEPVAARVARRAPRPALAFLAAILLFGGGAAALGWALRRSGDPNAPPAVDAADAETARADAERRTSIANAWRAMAVQGRPVLRDVLAAYFGAAAAPDERQAWRDSIGALAAKVHARYPESRSPAAWVEMVRYLTGQTAEALPALRELAASSGDDPFPKAVLALTLVVGYARESDVPQPTIVGHRLIFPERHIPPKLARARSAAAEALEAMQDEAAWHGIAEGAELRNLAEGARLLALEKHDEAAAALDEALADPMLGLLARLLRGLANAIRGKTTAAAEDLSFVARQGWVGAAPLASAMHLGAALEASLGGGDGNGHFDAGLAVLADAEAAGRRPNELAAPRYSLYLGRSRVLHTRGQDGRPDLERAAEVIRERSARDPSMALARGKALRELAERNILAGEGDPMALLEQSIQALGMALAQFGALAEREPRGPWRLNAQRSQEAVGRTQSVLAQWQQTRGDQRFRATYAAAIRTLENLLEQTPDRASTHNILADIYSKIARVAPPAARAQATAQAVGHARRYVELTGGKPHPRIELAKLLVAWAEASLSDVPAASARLDEAIVLLDQVLAEQPKEWVPYFLRSNANRMRAGLAGDLTAARKQADAALEDARTAREYSRHAAGACGTVVHALRMKCAVWRRCDLDAGPVFDAAVAEFAAAAQRHPELQQDPRLLNALGEAAEYAERWDAAESWYRRAVAVAPQWAAPRQRLQFLQARKR